MVSGDERVGTGAGGVDTAVLSPLHWTGHSDLLLVGGELQVLACSGTVSYERS